MRAWRRRRRILLKYISIKQDVRGWSGLRMYERIWYKEDNIKVNIK
jgi:hypothetical protein